MRAQRGFTLTELAVTLTIVAILAAVAAPSMSPMLVGNHIRTSGTDLMSALLLARSEAIKRNGQVSVPPTAGNWSQAGSSPPFRAASNTTRRTGSAPTSR